MSAHKLSTNEPDVSRKRIIRRDRYPVEPNTTFLKADQISIEVINYSAYGFLGYVPEDQQPYLQSTLQKSDFILSMHGVDIQQIKLGLSSNIQSLHKIPNTFGFEIKDGPLNIDRMRAIIAAEHIIKRMNYHSTTQSEIPNEFKTVVFEIKNWLLTLKQNIQKIEHLEQMNFLNDQNEFDHSIVECLATYMSQILPIHHQSLTDHFVTLNQSAMNACLDFIRTEFKTLLKDIKQLRRTTDPVGLQSHPAALARLDLVKPETRTFFHQAFLRYLANEPLLNTTHERSLYFSKQIFQMIQQKNTPKILAFGTKAADEIENLCRYPEFKDCISKRVEFHFVSQGQENMNQMKQDINAFARFSKCGFDFQFHPIEVLDFVNIDLHGFKFDLIYSADFFHYLTDPMAKMVSRRLFTQLNPDGLMLVENFSNSHTHMLLNEAYQQNNCVYRSQSDLKDLFDFSKKIQFESDTDVTTWFAQIKN